MDGRRPGRRLTLLTAAALLFTGAGYAAWHGRDDAAATQWAADAPAPPTGSAPTAPSTGSAPARPGGGTAAKPVAPPTKQERDAAVADAIRLIDRGRTGIRAGADERYTARGVLVDPGGARHVRFDRAYRGLPVLGGDFVLHVNRDGSLHDATVAQGEPIAVDTAPKVDARRAAEIATRQAPGRASTPTLVVDAAAGKPALAWQVVVADAEQLVVVDATTGAVRRAVPTAHTAEQGTGRGIHVGEVPLSTSRRPDGGFTLVDPDRGGSSVLDAHGYAGEIPSRADPFVDTDNAWGDGTPADPVSAAVDTHYSLAQTWDYFLRVHGRAGVDNDGRGTPALVHAGANLNNASWSENCRCVRFGDGDGTNRAYTSLDVVAHEFTHGVTMGSAQLNYFGESGALNESYSDVFGTLVEFAAQNPADPPDYLIGEKLRPDGSPTRWMDDPARDGKSASCQSPEVAYLDVHHSSGVPNKAFYLLAEGSGATQWGTAQPCGTAGPVTGIGRDKAGAIWYRALTTYLVSNSNFASARRATLLAAADLYGDGGPEQTAVAAAWTAVNVPADASPAALPEAPVVRHPGDPQTPVGHPVRLQIQARDHQGEALTYAIERLPQNLSMDANGLITGVPTFPTESHPKLTVTDASGHATVVEFTWSTWGPPFITGLADRTDETLSQVSVRWEVYTWDRDQIVYRVTGLPPGISRDIFSDTFKGTPTRPGVYPVSLKATDTLGKSMTVTFTWTIVAAPVPGAPLDLTATRNGTTVEVRWKAPPPAGQYSVDKYEITVSTGQTATSYGRGYTITGIDPATPVTVSVRAVSRAGTGPAATVEVAAAPSPSPSPTP